MLGCDLDVGFVADEEGRTFAGPSSRATLLAVRRNQAGSRRLDLGVTRGRANLVQSIILRLLTEQGELEGLGLPAYGSRHHRLIGEPNSEGNRSLVKLYVLECLRQEPRIARVLRVDVRPGEGLARRDTAVIEISAAIRGDATPLNLVVPFAFGSGVP